MPYCPKCRCDYREGFTTCADCGGPLAEGALPAEGGPAPAPAEADSSVGTAEGALPDAGGMVVVATILDGPADPDGEMEILTGRFAEAGIEFEVEEVVDSRQRKRAGERVAHPLPWYRLRTAAADAPRAKAIVVEEAHASAAALREAYADALPPEGEVPGAPPAAASHPETDSPTGLAAKVAIFVLGVLLLVAVARWIENR